METIRLKINDIAFGGSGVARENGKVVFVPFTIPGEEIEAKITKQKKNFAEGALLQIFSPSSQRVDPPCPYFGKCGGCSYQHIDYPYQLEIKQNQVEQTLKRVGRLAHVPMRPIMASPAEYNYRNRIRVHVEEGMAGFYAMGKQELIDIKQCLIAQPAVNEQLALLRRKSLPDGDYILAVERKNPFFSQTNDAVAELLLKEVKQILGKGKILVDAYSGAGFFAKYLLENFETVIGIEENGFAVDAAKKTATPKERYIAATVDSVLAEILSGYDPKDVTLVLDPPSIGASPRVVDAIIAATPARIVYVSCNPATLARDLSLLQSVYQINSVTPVDMFPQTAEIEVVVCLSAKE